MEIYLARDQGFCTGVASAVRIVENALKQYGTPLYVYHEIVHNTYVVENFRRQGVIFVDDIEMIPEHGRVIFSAHGVPPSIIKKAETRKLFCIDATCPLVKRIHKEAQNYSENNCHVILIGHRGHQEIIGTSGYIAPALLHIIQSKSDIEQLTLPADASIAYLTQTTLSVDDTRELIALLKHKFPNIRGPIRSDICYATQQRQDAVKELAKYVSVIIVCGSPTSSNSNRLREAGQRAGVKSHIIDRAEDLDREVIANEQKIGISSGASVPQIIVDELISKIKSWFPGTKVYTYVKNNQQPVLLA